MDFQSYYELHSLVAAVESLKIEDNIFKDYIFPLLTVIISTAAGWFIAHTTYSSQEKLQNEKEKLTTANCWILNAENAMHNLVTYKEYAQMSIGELSLPIFRSAKIQVLNTTAKPIDGNYAELSFILSGKKDINSDTYKWADIHRIRSLFENYNLLLDGWRVRNKLMENFNESIDKFLPSSPGYNLTQSDIINMVPSAQLFTLMMHTERVLKLTDGLMIELFNFTVEFPALARKRLDLDLLKPYGKLCGNFDTSIDERASKVFARILEPNFEELGRLGDLNAVAIRNSLKTPYDEVKLCIAKVVN